MAKSIFRPILAGAMFYRLKRICLFIGILVVCSCDFPQGMGNKESNITVILPGARNARSVLSDNEISLLMYKMTFTGPGGTVIERDVEGGSISLALSAGGWVIEARAYSAGDGLAVLVGTGTATVTVVPGQHQNVAISMYVDSIYEANLMDIYIHNEAELRRIRDFNIDDSMLRFYLERDIVLTQPWTPIGNDAKPFKALFLGDGHTITISSFSPEAGPYWGLFGRTEEANIESLTIVYDNLTGNSSSGNQWVGGVAGFATDTSIHSVHVKGKIEYSAGNLLNIGGLVGGAFGNSPTDTKIYASSFTGTLKGTGAPVSAGGILGGFDNPSSDATIKETYAAGTITATSSSSDAWAGGIAGDGACHIENCYAVAEVEASASFNAFAGGIIGRRPDTGMAFGKCYALGNVNAVGSTVRTGGIAGQSGSAIENCIALVNVNGGITGTMVGRLIGDFWNGTYSATTNYAANNKTITHGTLGATVVDGDTTHDDTAFQENESKYISWDFATIPPIWKWVTGYPYPVLSRQTEASN